MTEFYLAFSVHNSNCFITANKTVNVERPMYHEAMVLDGFNFRVGQSRTNSLRSAVKLLADDLQSNSQAQTVFDYFQELKAKGWKVVDGAFKTRHNLSDLVVVTSTPTPEPTTPVALEPMPDATETTPQPLPETIVEAETAPVVENPITAPKAVGVKPLGDRQKDIMQALTKLKMPASVADIQQSLKAIGMNSPPPSSIKASLAGLVRLNLVTLAEGNVTAYNAL